MARSASGAVRPDAGWVRTKWPWSAAPPISRTRSRSSIATHAPTRDDFDIHAVISCGRIGWYIARCGVAPMHSTPSRVSV